MSAQDDDDDEQQAPRRARQRVALGSDWLDHWASGGGGRARVARAPLGGPVEGLH